MYVQIVIACRKKIRDESNFYEFCKSMFIDVSTYMQENVIRDGFDFLRWKNVLIGWFVILADFK